MDISNLINQYNSSQQEMIRRALLTTFSRDVKVAELAPRTEATNAIPSKVQRSIPQAKAMLAIAAGVPMVETDQIIEAIGLNRKEDFITTGQDSVLAEALMQQFESSYGNSDVETAIVDLLARELIRSYETLCVAINSDIDEAEDLGIDSEVFEWGIQQAYHSHQESLREMLEAFPQFVSEIKGQMDKIWVDEYDDYNFDKPSDFRREDYDIAEIDSSEPEEPQSREQGQVIPFNKKQRR